MVSCYWVQPAQHPWFKPKTLKRKSPSMLLRSESPSPVDEDDADSRVKRQRFTTLTLEHTRPQKRKLPPSCPQSPIEEEDIVAKRQRCTVLEHGITRLSLTPPGHPVQDPAMPAPGVPELTSQFARPPFPVPSVPDYGFSPSWLPAARSLPAAPAVTTSFQPLPTLDPPPPFATTTTVPAAPASFAGGEDVKMRSSSWYEPEKDRIVVTDLDASSDDEDGVDDAPKLPRAVLQALLRGGPDPAARGDVPRMLLAGLLPSPSAPLPLSSPLLPPLSLELASFFPGPVSSDEAMDIE
ncbi:hypothetical protein EDB89DRAFT_1036093 [Lactarius sanguifluus]|nr:hypothetical protein EDB89DRAFT_1036093 [Lactarius sanguifluus]